MSRKKMWLGTQHHAQWVDCPLRGADMSPEGWGTDGTYLSGGGFVRQSQDSHRQYIFEWSGASSRQAAEVMQEYRDGVHSLSPDDLIYFIDPLIYDRNILPKRWAQPGLLAPVTGDTFSSLGSLALKPVPSNLVDEGLPIRGASIVSPFETASDFGQVTEPRQGCVYIPVPEGETVVIRIWGEWNVFNGIFVRSLRHNGTWADPAKVSGPFFVSGVRGFLLGSVGEYDLYGARVTVGNTPPQGWSPGLGHSGCRFVGNPSWTATSGVQGGQIGYAATLREVGDWDSAGAPSRPPNTSGCLNFEPSSQFPGALTVTGPLGYMSSPGLLSVPIGE